MVKANNENHNKDILIYTTQTAICAYNEQSASKTPSNIELVVNRVIIASEKINN